MAYINDTVFTNGLAEINTSGTRLDIVSADPTSVYACVTTNTMGNATVTPGTVEAATGGGNGMQVTIPAITTTNGAVTNTGFGTHWAVNNGINKLFASGPLTASQAVTSGNRFTLDKVYITIRNATTGA